MKRALLVLLLCLIVAAFGWALKGPKPTSITMSFTGFTNGVVGPIAQVFSILTTNNAASIQRWLDAGTNGILVTFTNQHSYAIGVLPVARIQFTNSLSIETPVLNSPNWSGIPLLPGQTATVQVALLPRNTPWRLVLIYNRRQSNRWLNSMVESVTGVLHENHVIQSGWMEN